MSQPEILRLGRRLAREIGGHDDEDSIRRWLAHHLAELIEAAPRDSAAAEQAVDTILRIWAKRETLPGDAWPVGRFREAVTVLERLSPAVEPWRRLRHTDDAAPLADLFSALNRLLLVALLVRVPSERRIADDSVPAAAMDEDEAKLTGALDALMAFLQQPKHAPDIPEVVVTIVDPRVEASPEPKKDSGDAPGETSGEDENGLSDSLLLDLMRSLVGELHGALDQALASTERLVTERAESATEREV